jgi:FAD:protein FMN transferase
MQAYSFEAMGTDVECLVESRVAQDEAFARVEDEFRRLEEIFTRFDEASELSRLNAAGSLEVGEELLEVTTLALDARERTAGRFDPTVHDAVVAAGYDRTFAELRPDDEGPEGPPRPGGGRVTVDPLTSRVDLGDGVRLDLGGIAKGYAVDRACDLLAPSGPCLVDAGGDLAVRGLPEQGVWPIEVETPAGGLTLGVRSGALATSGTDRRRWRRNGEERHHLIDPASGRPAVTDVLRVTVAAGTAVEAEVLAKALLLAGAERAAAEADALDVPCVLVTQGGSVVAAGGLA